MKNFILNIIAINILSLLSLNSLSLAQLKKNDAIPGQYLVKFKQGKSSGPSSIQGKISGKAEMKAASSAWGGIYQIKFKSHINAKAEAQDLAQDPNIEYIEPDYLLEKADDVAGVPLEVLSREEVVSGSSAQYLQSGSQAKVVEAWAAASTSSTNKPIVAVVDTGVDVAHSVFVNSGALWSNTREIPNNGADDDFNGYVDDYYGFNFYSNVSSPMDDQGHGTHVAGIIVGAGIDIFASQLSPSLVQVMSLKFMNSQGQGSTSNAIKAIYYAVDNGAKVINCSWGGPSYSKALHDAFSYAYSHGVILATAAGNYGKDNDVEPLYPSNLDVPSNISVAAVNDYDSLASFSNFGVHTVSLASPGVLIYSTLPGNKYGLMSGTSMATPFVAGVAALAMRESPQLTGYQVKNLILSTVDSVSNLSSKVISSGRVDALGVVNAAKAQVASSTYQPNYSPSYGSERAPSSSDGGGGSSGGGGGGCGMITDISKMNGGGSGHLGFMLGVFMLPLIVWVVLRKKESGQSKRKFERFQMNSQIQVQMGDKELVGSLKTISVGGLSFSVEEALEKGGVVSMKIQGPDGQEMVEVQGHIVWSEKNKAYGVQFDQANDNVLSMIHNWTRNLMKA